MPVSTAARRVSSRFVGGSLQTIVNSTSTGAGIAYDLRGGYSNIAASVVGPSTSFKMKLQGSEDGVNWFTLKSTIARSTVGQAVASTTTYPVQFVRGVATAGTTSTAHLMNAYIVVN